MIDLAAVILVGGKSSRMGRDKATLAYRGKRLADVVADGARAAGISRIYVSGELEGYTSLPDLLSGHGPVSGICTCALRLSGNHRRLLFIPVDMPHVTPDLLRLLVNQPPEQPCYFEEHPLPCMIHLDPATLRYMDETIRQLAERKSISVSAFLAALGAAAIPVPEAMKIALTNTNTPGEWEEATHESAH